MRKITSIVLLCAWLFMGVPVFAQPTEEDPGASRATEFQAVDETNRPGDEVPGGVLLIVAYGIVWVLVFGYVFMVGRIGRETSRRLGELEQRVEAACAQR